MIVPDVYVTTDLTVRVEVGDVLIAEERGFLDKNQAEQRVKVIAEQWGATPLSPPAVCMMCGHPRVLEVFPQGAGSRPHNQGVNRDPQIT